MLILISRFRFGDWRIINVWRWRQK